MSKKRTTKQTSIRKYIILSGLTDADGLYFEPSDKPIDLSEHFSQQVLKHWLEKGQIMEAKNA